MPKRSSLTEYSGRVDPKLCAGPMDRWRRALNALETDLGGDGSFDLDFQANPWHGKDPETPTTEAQYIQAKPQAEGHSRLPRPRRRGHLLVYANARTRKQFQNDGVLRFIEF